jgi:hypothetical protein
MHTKYLIEEELKEEEKDKIEKKRKWKKNALME